MANKGFMKAFMKTLKHKRKGKKKIMLESKQAKEL